MHGTFFPYQGNKLQVCPWGVLQSLIRLKRSRGSETHYYISIYLNNMAQVKIKKAPWRGLWTTINKSRWQLKLQLQPVVLTWLVTFSPVNKKHSKQVVFPWNERKYSVASTMLILMLSTIIQLLWIQTSGYNSTESYAWGLIRLHSWCSLSCLLIRMFSWRVINF